MTNSLRRTINQSLKEWLDEPGRMPLILRGARQVGKTFEVHQFAQSESKRLIEINFELEPRFKTCFEDLDPVKIIDAITLIKDDEINTNRDLLFLDEIQECPQAIMALRYFKEKMPELPVIAAGSLLEFTLNQENFRMPVGRVQSLYMQPVSFKEYVAANNQKLAKHFETISLDNPPADIIDFELKKLLREYFVLGGMPDVIAHYLNTNQLQGCQKRQAAILNTYRNDFSKYATTAQIKYLQRLFEQTPSLVAQHFKFSKVDPHMQTRDLKLALLLLKDAGLIHLVYRSSASGIPLNANINEKKFKLLFLDIGLTKQASGLDPDIMLKEDLMLMNQGQLVEQFVGQELLCSMPNYTPANLYYWENEKRGSLAEMDYCIQINDKIIPIEVKSGKTGSLRSLHFFMQSHNSALGVQIAMQPLSFNNNILTIPLYLISELPRLIKELI